DVSHRIEAVERELDALDVAPGQVVANDRARQERLVDSHGDRASRDLDDAIVRCRLPTRIAAPEVAEDAPIRHQRGDEVGLGAQRAAGLDDEPALRLEPLTEVPERVVEPRRARTLFDGRGERFRGPPVVAAVERASLE